MIPPSRIYLDANVLIELFEKRSTEASNLLWDLIGAVGSSAPEFLLSELAITEIAVDPLRKGDQEVFNLYRQHISDKPGLWSVMPVDRQVLEMAANVRARLAGVRLPDAIHLATAILGKCDVFVSNDRRFSRAAMRDPLMPIRTFVTFEPAELLSLIGSIRG